MDTKKKTTTTTTSASDGDGSEEIVRSLRAQFWSERTRHVELWGRPVTVSLPKRTDPRLMQIGMLFTGTLLGQFVFGFKVNVGQILLAVGTCALLDMWLCLRTERMLMLPASGLISGLSIGLLLRTGPGAGKYLLYVLTAALAILSKYFIRRRGSHVYNPSNFGLAIVLIAFSGIAQVTPSQWHRSWWLITLFVVGGLMITQRAHVLSVALTFGVVESITILMMKAEPHRLTWHLLFHPALLSLTTPAVLVFAFFMVTDPRTVPKSVAGKVIFAGTTVLLQQMMVSFGVGVRSIYVALLIVCSAVLLADLVPWEGWRGAFAPSPEPETAGSRRTT